MNPDENTPEDGARFQPQMNETPEQSASETPSPVLPAPATPAAGDASFTQSAPVASAEETDAETEKAAPVALAPAPVKRGPGWEPCSSRWSAVSEWQPAEPWYLARICVPLLPPPGQPDFRPCTSKLCWNCSRLGSGFGNRVSRGRDNQRLWAKLFRHRLRRDC